MVAGQPHSRQDLQRCGRAVLGPQQRNGGRQQLKGGCVQHHQADHTAAGLPLRGCLLQGAHGLQPGRDSRLPQPQQVGGEVHRNRLQRRAARGELREQPPGDRQQRLAERSGQAALHSHLHHTRPETESSGQPQQERDCLAAAGEKRLGEVGQVPLKQRTDQGKAHHSRKQN